MSENTACILTLAPLVLFVVALVITGLWRAK